MSSRRAAINPQVRKPPVPGQEVPGGGGGFPRWAMPALLLFTAFVFRDVLDFSITFIDDDMYILRNPYLRNFSAKGVVAVFSSFYEFNYHPLTTLLWMVLYKIWGLNPMPYHAANLLLHLVNTWLVYRLASALARQNLTGFMVAALFALHPLHVESVAWISELKGVLCASFYFAALLAYMRYIDGGYPRKKFFVMLCWFIAALLSKSAAVTLPLAALAIDIYSGRPLVKSLVEKIPLLALSVLFGILAIMSQSSGGSMGNIAGDYNILNRVVVFLAGLAFYFVKAVVPYHLSAIHYFPNEVNGVLPWYFYACLVVLPLVAWLVWRARSGRREVVFGLLFFLSVISVMLQFMPVGAAYATERYTYVSYFGLFYIAAAWAVRQKTEARQRILPAFAGLLVVFSFVSAGRAGTWANTETIFADLVEKNEGNRNNYLVYYHWGDYYQQQGRMQDAVSRYSEVLKLQPGYTAAYVRRGEVYDAMGNLAAAVADYDRVLVADPSHAMTWNNLGWVYFEQGKPQEAIRMFDSAIVRNGRLATAYNNRGWVQLQQGDTTGAMTDFTRAIKAEPLFAKAFYNRALVNAVRGKRNEAIADYTAILAANERDAQAYFFRGIMYRELGRELPARHDFEAAASLGYNGARDALNAAGR